MSNQLAEFHGATFSIIDHDGIKWLTAEDAGLALGYAPGNASAGVRNMYNRHEDEFTKDDARRINLSRRDGKTSEQLIFSESGCNMLGFFANTPRAKEFRQWAKQVLAGQAGVAAAHTDARLDRVEDAVLQMAQGMQVLLKANSTTQKYIELLEINQRGTYKVTYERALEVMQLVAGGYSQASAARLVRISAATTNQIIKATYAFSVGLEKPDGWDEQAQALREKIAAARALLLSSKGGAA